MEKRCYNCMEPLNDEGACPKCGFEGEPSQDGAALKAGTLLKDRYYIGNLFSKTLDSAVYIAYDEELGKKVFVREFTGEDIAKLTNKSTPTELVQRFLSYAKSTATISLNDIIPRTVDTFAENSVGYLVTDHFEGESLKTLLNSGIKISASNAMKIAEKLLKGIKAIHNSGVIYGAISPDTLYILKNGEVRLFGLGSVFYDFTDDIDCRVELLNPSYAAPELFDSAAKVGVYCDVYSVAAILYRMLTNTIPAISFLRSGGENLVSPKKTDKSIPKNIETALLNALNWQCEKRTATPTAFLEELTAKKVKRKRSAAMIWASILGFFQSIYDISASKKNKAPKEKTTEKEAENNESKGKLGLLWLWITIPAVILIALIVFLVIIFLPSSENTADTSSTATSSEDIWYYGSGIETPGNNSEYVYGGYSSKKPVSSKQSNNSRTQSVDPNAVECPDLAGYTLSQAKSILESSNLLLGEVIYDYSNDYPIDYVMAQSLKSGGMVQKGSKIDVVVCKGRELSAELPDVAGKDMKAAAEQIIAAGFNNIEYSFFSSDDAPGTVTEVFFKTDESSGYESVVIITVSGEKADIYDYCGKTVAEAKSLSPDISFIYKTEDGADISSITDAGATAYTVVSQDVLKDAPAYKGMTVTLTVKG